MGEPVTARARNTSGAARDKVTINDVARAAGVSRQTVSNVLNGSGRVGAVARARVLDVVADVAVTGFGGSISAGLLHPHPTTVVIPVADLAGCVVGRVLANSTTGRTASKARSSRPRC